MSKRIIKPLLLLAPLVAVLAIFASIASADRGRHNGRDGIAFGNAQFTVSPGQDERFRFLAKDRGLSLNDRGFIVYRNATAGFAYDAELECAAVSGKSARFGYVIPSDASVPAGIRGLGIVFEVVDNGKPGAGRDLVGYVSGPAAVAAVCDTTPVPNLTAIKQGNILVRPGKPDREKPKPKPPDDDTDDTDDSEDTTDDTDD